MYIDTYILFDDVFNRHEYLMQAIVSTSATSDSYLNIAIAGFSLYADPNEWRSDHAAVIDKALEELSPETLDWYENCVDALRRFCIAVEGALLGKFLIQEIDERGHLLYQMHLPAYISEYPEICERFAL